jgi:hypothetical protein
LQRNTAGRRARAADFAPSNLPAKACRHNDFVPNPAEWLKTGALPPFCRLMPVPLSRSPRGRSQGFNQIGLGIAKVLEHKKRRRQGADRTSG